MTRDVQSITIHNDTTIYSVHIAPVARSKFILGIGGKACTNFVLKIDGDDDTRVQPITTNNLAEISSFKYRDEIIKPFLRL